MNHDDEIATRERLARHWLEVEPVVRAYVRAAVRGYADAQDVVQQVALTIARRFDEYDEQRPFIAWALSLTKWAVASHYRKLSREQRVSTAFSDELLSQLAEAMTAQQPAVSARQAALERCVGQLPEKSRRLMKMRYEEGASSEQMAALLPSTVSAVRVMLFRIRNVLAGCIEREIAKEARPS